MARRLWFARPPAAQISSVCQKQGNYPSAGGSCCPSVATNFGGPQSLTVRVNGESCTIPSSTKSRPAEISSSSIQATRIIPTRQRTAQSSKKGLLWDGRTANRSEEHTSELQSLRH